VALVPDSVFYVLLFGANPTAVTGLARPESNCQYNYLSLVQYLQSYPSLGALMCLQFWSPLFRAASLLCVWLPTTLTNSPVKALECKWALHCWSFLSHRHIFLLPSLDFLSKMYKNPIVNIFHFSSLRFFVFFHYKLSTTTISNSTADEGSRGNHSLLSGIIRNSRKVRLPRNARGLWWAWLHLLLQHSPYRCVLAFFLKFFQAQRSAFEKSPKYKNSHLRRLGSA